MTIIREKKQRQQSQYGRLCGEAINNEFILFLSQHRKDVQSLP